MVRFIILLIPVWGLILANIFKPYSRNALIVWHLLTWMTAFYWFEWIMLDKDSQS